MAPELLHKYPAYTEYSRQVSIYHSGSLYGQPFSRYKIVKNQKCTQWPQNVLKHLTVKVPVHTEYLSPMPKIHTVSLYDQPFSRYKVVENRKCT